jgi:hypothetical protein
MLLFGKKTIELSSTDNFDAVLPVQQNTLKEPDYSSFTDTYTLAENDLIESITQSTIASFEMRAGVQRVSDAAFAVGNEIRGFADLSSGAKKAVSDLADAVSVISQAVNSTYHQVGLSLDTISKAEQQAKAAISRMDELQKSVAEISEITLAIAKIAKQTHLLALNATIEAARAGASGRGFAVVASEVKQLSLATQSSTSSIAEKIESVKRHVNSSSEQVSIIASSIFELTGSIQTISDEAKSQSEALSTTNQSVNSAVNFANQVNSKAVYITDLEQSLALEISTMDVADSAMSAKIVRVNDHATILMRLYSKDNQQWQRWPFLCQSTLEDALSNFEVKTVDISVYGASIVSDSNLSRLVGKNVVLKIPQLGSVPALVTFVRSRGADLKFLPMADNIHHALQNLVSAAAVKSAPHILHIQNFAAEIAAEFEKSIIDKRIDMDDLFDTDYKFISESDPAQFENKSTSFLKTILPPLSERELKNNPLVRTMVAHDRNGYIGAREAVTSQPQRVGQKEWNLIHSRDKRMFDDHAGLLAVRDMHPVLSQGYPREMGDSYELVAEFSAPIFVWV